MRDELTGRHQKTNLNAVFASFLIDPKTESEPATLEMTSDCEYCCASFRDSAGCGRQSGNGC